MIDIDEPAAEMPSCLADFRRAAKAVLRSDVWDFIEGGSGMEKTIEANRAAFDGIALVPRVLAGVITGNTRGRLLGSEVAMPVAIAPMAYQRLVHRDGEIAAARAACSAGIPFVMSTMSSCRFGDITATGARTWFQLYWLRDHEKVVELVSNAENLGCQALVVTVDVPIMGRRNRDVRNQFALPPDVGAVNLDSGPTEANLAASGTSAIATYTDSLFAQGLAWRDLEWLRQHTALPLVVKGILDPRDARLAVECGVDAVVVSNHGGRQLDGAPPSIAELPAVVEAVSGECEVLLDSGVRSGTDVLRALALGAVGMLIGRPALWGLAVGGERGIAEVLSLLQVEFREAMTLAGCADLAAAARLRTREVSVNARRSR
ncbi:MAG: alpha-hydroxy acid oxidase [Pseudonocardiaceae bacterium]